MYGILPKFRFVDKERLVDRTRRCCDAQLKGHYRIIVNLINAAPRRAQMSDAELRTVI